MINESWFYLSFVHGDRPRGDQFVGGCFVRATNIGDACSEAHRLGCNPGGEVLGVGPNTNGKGLPPVSFRERLLTRAEIKALDDLMPAQTGGA